MKVLLDTHVWVWMCVEPERLSRHARTSISKAETRCVSVLSAWEIALLVTRERLCLSMPLQDWIAESVAQAELSVRSLTLSEVMESTRLPEPLHRDPVDRFLVATARANDLALITADRRLRDYAHVRTVW